MLCMWMLGREMGEIEQASMNLCVSVHEGLAELANARYYENLGFRNVGDFSLTRRNGSVWPGTLYCMDLTQNV
jgi:hypothetical protein